MSAPASDTAGNQPLAPLARGDLALLEVSVAVCGPEEDELYWRQADQEFIRRGEVFSGSYQRLLEAGMVEDIGDGCWRLTARGRLLGATLTLPEAAPLGRRLRPSALAG